MGSSHLQPQGFRLYRRNAAGSNRDAAAHCNREPRRHRPQLVPRQVLPARTTAPRTFDPETLYDAQGRKKCHRRKHLPLSGRRGTPCRLLPPRRHRDPHLATEIRSLRGGEQGRCTAEGNPTQESKYQSDSKKRGRELSMVFGAGVEPRSHLGMIGSNRDGSRGYSPRAPARLPATLPDRARPRETPSIGPPPKTAPAALYSLCPRSCSPLHHSCRPGAPQN